MRRIVIVGASSGIGRELARLFIDMGWIVGIASRRLEPLEELRQIAPERVFAAEIDVQSEGAVTHLNSLIDSMGGMDIYLHSSGIGHQNRELQPEIEIETIKTNAEGFVRMTCAAFNYLRSRAEGGQIVGITSVAGCRGGGAAPAYGASKGMQSLYLDSLAQLSRSNSLGIYITDILPGFVATPLIGECPYPMVMSVEYAAKRIARAVVTKRRRAVIDWRYSLLILVWRLIPRFIWERMKL